MINIDGGEVLSHRGTTVNFKLKCKKCGNIDESESSITVMRGVTEVTTKRCPKCGANQIVKMKIDMN